MDLRLGEEAGRRSPAHPPSSAIDLGCWRGVHLAAERVAESGGRGEGEGGDI